MIYPAVFEWTSEGVMRPLNRYVAGRQYVVGEHYRLEPREDRSAASHSHFFAAVAEAHANLPEDLAGRWPTPDALRKYALIRTGHRDERSYVAKSKAQALELAAFIKPMNEFAVVMVHEASVIVMTAKSQSLRAMGKADFQRSKDDVLGFLADLIGVSPDALSANTGKAA